MNNPLRHVGQTAHPEKPDTPGEKASAQQLPTDAAGNRVSQPPSGQKDIPDLEPGEPPPESSAGS